MRKRALMEMVDEGWGKVRCKGCLAKEIHRNSHGGNGSFREVDTYWEIKCLTSIPSAELSVFGECMPYICRYVLEAGISLISISTWSKTDFDTLGKLQPSRHSWKK